MSDNASLARFFNLTRLLYIVTGHNKRTIAMATILNFQVIKSKNPLRRSNTTAIMNIMFVIFLFLYCVPFSRCYFKRNNTASIATTPRMNHAASFISLFYHRRTGLQMKQRLFENIVKFGYLVMLER